MLITGQSPFLYASRMCETRESAQYYENKLLPLHPRCIDHELSTCVTLLGVLWNSAQRLITKEMCRLSDIIIQEKFFKKECLGKLRFEKMVLGMGSWA